MLRMRDGEIAIIERLNFSPFDLNNIAATADPV